MKASVITVMHSGTHLLRYCVLRAYYKPDDKDPLYSKEPLFDSDSGNELYAVHLDQEVNYNFGGPIFSSLRHPARVAQSFLGRKRSLDEFRYQWDRLINECHPHVDAYLHVDSIANRNRQVLMIGDILGVHLECEWSLTGRSGSRLGNHNIAIDRCPSVPSEYIEFYHDTI